MPKQGQFAKAVRQAKINNFKVKRHDQDRVIDESQLTDFLVVRFALTAKKRLPLNQRETAQRLLQEIAPRLRDHQGDLKALVQALVVSLNAKVPWQFWQQVSAFWPTMQHFLRKEVPAVLLKEPILITQTLNQGELNQILAQALAQKVATAMLLGQQKATPAQINQMATMLVASLIKDETIDWERVSQLMTPFPFTIDESLDDGTKQWLSALSI